MKKVLRILFMVSILLITLNITIYANSENIIEDYDYISKNIETGEISFDTAEKYNTNINLMSENWILENGSKKYTLNTNINNDSPYSLYFLNPMFEVGQRKVYPYSTVCYIEMTYPNGTTRTGSAVLISDDIALTAGHCVYNHERGGWAESIRVVPDMFGTIEPYGSTWSKVMHTSEGWVNNENSYKDWALLELSDPIGYTSDNQINWNYIRCYQSLTALNDKPVTVTGYPINKGYKMYTASGLVTSSEMERFYYDLDTVDGFSGGPVTDTDGKVIGIHSGTLKTDATKKYCVRITEDLFNYFTSFTD